MIGWTIDYKMNLIKRFCQLLLCLLYTFFFYMLFVWNVKPTPTLITPVLWLAGQAARPGQEGATGPMNGGYWGRKAGRRTPFLPSSPPNRTCASFRLDEFSWGIWRGLLTRGGDRKRLSRRRSRLWSFYVLCVWARRPDGTGENIRKRKI